MKTNLATLLDSGKSKIIRSIQMIHGRVTRSSIIVDVSYVAAIFIQNTSLRLTTGPGNNRFLCVLWLSQRRETARTPAVISKLFQLRAVTDNR